LSKVINANLVALDGALGFRMILISIYIDLMSIMIFAGPYNIPVRLGRQQCHSMLSPGTDS
jgi:hypothetical protein